MRTLPVLLTYATRNDEACDVRKRARKISRKRKASLVKFSNFDSPLEEDAEEMCAEDVEKDSRNSS
jgi:hypothetical protein